MKQGEIIMYQPDESIRLEVRMEEETVWLNLNQMSLLFGRDKSVISRHIRNVYIEGELPIPNPQSPYKNYSNYILKNL